MPKGAASHQSTSFISDYSAVKVPDDVLYLIFHAYLEITNADYSRSRLKERQSPREHTLGILHLSHVCGAWRSVAIAFSPLWRRIPLCSPELVNTFIQRAKAEKLQIVWRPYNSRRKILEESLLIRMSKSWKGILADEDIVNRVSVIDFDGPVFGESDMEEYHSRDVLFDIAKWFFPEASAPPNDSDSNSSSRVSPDPPQSLGNWASLEVLRIRGPRAIYKAWNITDMITRRDKFLSTSRQLRVLHFHDFYDVSTSLFTNTAVFANLEHLVLCNLKNILLLDLAEHVAQMPSLKFLELYRHSWESQPADVSPVSPRIELPASLRHIVLQVTIPSMRSFLENIRGLYVCHVRLHVFPYEVESMSEQELLALKMDLTILAKQAAPKATFTHQKMCDKCGSEHELSVPFMGVKPSIIG